MSSCSRSFGTLRATKSPCAIVLGSGWRVALLALRNLPESPVLNERGLPKTERHPPPFLSTIAHGLESRYQRVGRRQIIGLFYFLLSPHSFLFARTSARLGSIRDRSIPLRDPLRADEVGHKWLCRSIREVGQRPALDDPSILEQDDVVSE